MAEQKKLAKRRIQRLELILRTLDEREARMQQAYGNRTAGTVRSSDWRDAEAIRAVKEGHRG